MLRPGVTHWLDRSSPDGTILDLFEFDFAANPTLRLEIYDQDEDDDHPFDDSAKTWPRGVGQVVRHLNQLGHVRIVAAWNGLFFSSEGRGPTAIGHHIAPVVLRGHVFYNVGNHRWTFGVQYRHGKPAFKTIHLPDRSTLARAFDYAAGGAQCLVRDGVPLRLPPPPLPNAPTEKGPIPSTPQEVGHIPLVDHMKTSRASLGWTKDSQRLYLLFVTEPDNETESALALRHGWPDRGGWTVAELQQFWKSKGVWGAINSDGGDVAQLAFIHANGRYTLIPPRWAAGNVRLTFRPDFANAPQGGSLMYFYVADRR